MPLDPLDIKTIDSDTSEYESDISESEKKLETGFVFQSDGGAEWVQSWDFSDAKKNATKLRKSTLDEKIAKHRQDLDLVESEEGESEAQEDEFVSGSESDQDSEPEKVKDFKHDDPELPEDVVQDKRKKEYFEEAPITREDEMESFTSLSLSRPILKAIAAMGFVKPTDIQAKTIPLALQGRDICGSAVTGSGKTAAFMIPILERLFFRPKAVPAIRVLVLVPTRELGAQCHSVCQNLSKFSEITSSLCVGGLSTKLQEAELKKKPDVVIATPGRLIDHIHNSHSFSLDEIEILVIDEADRILEDGFKAELEEIIKYTPVNRQTMLFSATMTDNVDELIRLSLKRPVRLFVDNAQSMTSKLVQEFIRVRGHREEARPAILAALCARTYTSETIIFFRSKAAAHHMKIVFGLLGLSAAELHGNLTQLQRLEALEQFRDKKVNFLLATDVASRGLDIKGIKTVINYDMPTTYQVYVHRCGRTARGDAAGKAVSLVGEQDRPILKLALKNSRDAVKHRIVPAPVIEKYEKLIETLKETIKEIYHEEKEEKMLQQTEMQITRAENKLIHEDEIKARPARVWFQSEKEKAQLKKLEEKAVDKPKRAKTDGMSRKKKRLYFARQEEKQEMAKQSIAAKHAKAAVKPKRLSAFNDSTSTQSKGQNKKKRIFDEELSSKKKRRK